MHISIVALKSDSLYCVPQLDISYDTFIRTTDEVHARVVGEMMSRVWDRDVYRSEYRGWYCVGCEEYKDELELEPGREGSGVRLGKGSGNMGPQLSYYVPTHSPRHPLAGHACPIHRKPCELREEDNYFFALSKYQAALEVGWVVEWVGGKRQ